MWIDEKASDLNPHPGPLPLAGEGGNCKLMVVALHVGDLALNPALDLALDPGQTPRGWVGAGHR